MNINKALISPDENPVKDNVITIFTKKAKLKKTRFCIACLTFLSASMLSQYALATPHKINCGPGKHGLKVFNYNFNLNGSGNHPGATTGWDQQGNVDGWYIGGHCGQAFTRLSPVYWTFEPAAGVTYEQIGDARWMNMPNNNYLQIGMQLYIDGDHKGYEDVPANRVSNQCEKNCNLFAVAHTASMSRVRVRIKTPFVGESVIPNRRILNIYGETNKTTNKGEIAAVVELGLRIIVPQSCTIRTGDTITFDFKEIATAAFSNTGAGNRPAGINIQSESMSLDCKSMAAEQMFKAILRAPNASNNIILSNNADVGFQVAGSDNQALIPNNENSKIRFKLDGSGKSNIQLKAWPVATTGKVPQAGSVSSTAHIIFQFD